MGAHALVVLASLAVSLGAAAASKLSVGPDGSLEVNGKAWFNGGNVSVALGVGWITTTHIVSV